MKAIMQENKKYLLFIILLIAIDLISKVIMDNTLKLSSLSVYELAALPSQFNLILMYNAENKEVFGIKEYWFTVFVSFPIFLIFLYNLIINKNVFFKVAACLIIAGYSNLIEIGFKGHAVDFIFIKSLGKLPFLQSDHLYIFNIADIYIVLGSAMWFIAFIIMVSKVVVDIFKKLRASKQA